MCPGDVNWHVLSNSFSSFLPRPCNHNSQAILLVCVLPFPLPPDPKIDILLPFTALMAGSETGKLHRDGQAPTPRGHRLKEALFFVLVIVYFSRGGEANQYADNRETGRLHKHISITMTPIYTQFISHRFRCTVFLRDCNLICHMIH